MTEKLQKFDTLADDYDRYRPRYPAVLLDAVADLIASLDHPFVVDAGAGTGIALEGLIPRLGATARVAAVDVSSDMVAAGRAKFPQVDWTVGPAEPFLESCRDVALVVAAQAFQWMDRTRFLAAARGALRTGGAVAIIQNNRAHASSAFLDAYESLLEDLSPGYSRRYRDFDFRAELQDAFGDTADVRVRDTTWTMPMPRDEFVGMSRSSTQAQRAIDAHGDDFLRRLETLIDEHAEHGDVEVAYRSELFSAVTCR